MHLDAAQLLERVDDGVLVGAERERHPGVVQRRAGPMPSARSRSVVGQKHAVARAPASSSTSLSDRCVAWTTVVVGREQPLAASSSVGEQP